MPRIFILLFASASVLQAAQNPVLSANCGQVILGISDKWNSSHATLQIFEKSPAGWIPVAHAWPARLGKNGLAWGRGLHPPIPPDESIPFKKEGDWKSPAGVFELGGVYSTDAQPPATRFSCHRVSEQDLWIEDSRSPYYNTHLQLGRPPQNHWERKQQMRLNDPAHRIKLFIRHNAPPDVVPGAGSAIFFHIWRGGGSEPTAGCVSMSEENLRLMLQKLNPQLNPCLVLLPMPFYQSICRLWRLP